MSDNALIRALRSFGQGASNAVASNVSAPVDGLAWLLRKGGLPIPQNPVGGSDWMAQQGLTATPQNKLAGLLGETAGMVGPAVVQAAAPKIAGGLLALDDKAMDMARQGVENYMGSTGLRQDMLYHGGELVPNPTAYKQAVMTRGVPAVSSSPNMLEAARYAIHNNGPINAIDDSAMRIYRQGMNKKLDAAYKANNFDAIRDAGFDGVKLFHSNEHVLFDPAKTLKASKKVADVYGGYNESGVVKQFLRADK